MSKDTYRQIENHGLDLARCPVCGALGELWEYTDPDDRVQKVIMCSTEAAMGPLEDGCILSFPPQDFLKATRREAAKAWNDFAAMARHMRTVNDRVNGTEDVNHYLLIKRESFARDGAPLSAYASACALLKERIWPLFSSSKCRRAIKKGDRVAIYLAGVGNQIVIATAKVADVLPWAAHLAKTYPLVLDGTPEIALRLDAVDVFNAPLPIGPRLTKLSFYSGSRKWGAAFMGGARSLSAADYRELTT